MLYRVQKHSNTSPQGGLSEQTNLHFGRAQFIRARALRKRCNLNRTPPREAYHSFNSYTNYVGKLVRAELFKEKSIYTPKYCFPTQGITNISIFMTLSSLTFNNFQSKLPLLFNNYATVINKHRGNFNTFSSFEINSRTDTRAL